MVPAPMPHESKEAIAAERDTRWCSSGSQHKKRFWSDSSGRRPSSFLWPLMVTLTPTVNYFRRHQSPALPRVEELCWRPQHRRLGGGGGPWRREAANRLVVLRSLPPRPARGGRYRMGGARSGGLSFQTRQAMGSGRFCCWKMQRLREWGREQGWGTGHCLRGAYGAQPQPHPPGPTLENFS